MTTSETAAGLWRQIQTHLDLELRDSIEWAHGKLDSWSSQATDSQAIRAPDAPRGRC